MALERPRGRRCPHKEMVPASGVMAPRSISRVVVLPAPLGPSKPTRWPGATVTLTPLTAWTSPKRFTSPRASSTGSTEASLARPPSGGPGNFGPTYRGTMLSDREYRALARFRHALRVFLRFSEEAARAHGVTPAQHQLLLAIRGHDGMTAPTVGDMADALQQQHHSVVELVNRAAEAGLVARTADQQDRR